MSEQNEGEKIGAAFYQKYGKGIEAPIVRAVERMKAEGDGDSLALLAEQLRVARELVLQIGSNGVIGPFDPGGYLNLN